MDTLQEQKQTGKQDHTVRYIIYAAAAYFGLQYLFKPKRATATVVTLPPTEQVVVANDSTAAAPVKTVISPIQTAVKTSSSESFPLRKGMRGQRIQALQQKLGVSADGIFGNQTAAALSRQFGITTVTAPQYASIMLSKQKVVPPTVSTNTNLVLKKGSKGADVYRLQKWLGFKDRAAARKGEPIADSDFGQQTENAVLRRTGQRSISIAMLNQYTKKTIAGVGITDASLY